MEGKEFSLEQFEDDMMKFDSNEDELRHVEERYAQLDEAAKKAIEESQYDQSKFGEAQKLTREATNYYKNQVYPLRQKVKKESKDVQDLGEIG